MADSAQPISTPLHHLFRAAEEPEGHAPIVELRCHGTGRIGVASDHVMGCEFCKEVSHWTTDAGQATEFHEIVDLRRHFRGSM